MGDATRMGRVTRFIDEFNDDAVKYEKEKLDFSCPQLLSVGLGYTDSSYQVFLYYTVRGKSDGDEIELALTDVLFFDPDSDDDDTIERTTSTLGISRNDAVRRLQKARLIW